MWISILFVLLTTVEHLAAAGIVPQTVILTTPLLNRTEQRAWESQAHLFGQVWNTNPSELLFIIQPKSANPSKSIQLFFKSVNDVKNSNPLFANHTLNQHKHGSENIFMPLTLCHIPTWEQLWVQPLLQSDTDTFPFFLVYKEKPPPQQIFGISVQ